MPKPRKNTRAATRSRPRGGALLPFLSLKGVPGAVAAAFMRVAVPVAAGCAAAAAWLWRARNARRAAGVVAGLCLCVAIAWSMQANLRSSPRFQVDPARIELAAEPTWARPELATAIKSDIESSLRATAARMAPTDAFDADLPESLARELAACAWVRSVVRVERRFPAGPDAPSHYVPVLEIRRPAMLVEQGDRLIGVDGDAVVLPLAMPVADLEAFQARLVTSLRVIKGVRTPPPAPGQPWRSEQINAALSMESILRRSELDRAFPIAVVELIGVPEQPDSRGRVHYAADGCVMLWPDQRAYPGARLIWGRPPVHASTLEASPNDKLAELRRKLDQPPEALVGTRIDLRRRAS